MPAIGIFQRYIGATEVIEGRERVIEDTATYLKQAEQKICTGEYLTTSSAVVVHDDVAKTLVDIAAHGEHLAEGAAGVDMIALTTHGRGGLQRWALGSITERVIAETKLPVFIVHGSAG
jgi:nucleotide-binding universal stress UspA family protein